MNVLERMLRERNLELIFDQHNDLRRQYIRGVMLMAGGIFGEFFILSRVAWGYWAFSSLLVSFAAAFCLMAFILGTLLFVLSIMQVKTLPWPGDDLDEPPPPAQPIFQQETRPVTIRVEHINDNQMQIRPVDLDMEQAELDQFALAIRNNRDGLIGRMAITKRLIKHRTNIKNVDGRYRHWFRQLREADAIQDISGTWYLTDVGEAILDELSPAP